METHSKGPKDQDASLGFSETGWGWAGQAGPSAGVCDSQGHSPHSVSPPPPAKNTRGRNCDSGEARKEIGSSLLTPRALLIARTGGEREVGVRKTGVREAGGSEGRGE